MIKRAVVKLPVLLLEYIKEALKTERLPSDPAEAFYFGARLAYEWMRKMYRKKRRKDD